MISALYSSTWVRQFARFVVVGCGNVLVSFAVFMFFYRFFPLGTFALESMGSYGARIEADLARLGVHSIDAGLANTLGCAAGMVNSFLLNKHWTFGAEGMTALQLRRFVALNIAVITGSSLLIFAFIDMLQAEYLPVWVVVTGLAMMANFLGNKFWTFTESEGFGRAAARASDDGNP
jgi:putative flippase GtrA